MSTATTREWDRLYALEDAQKSGWAMIEIEGVRWVKMPAGHVIVALDALHVDALEFVELKKKHAKLEADYAYLMSNKMHDRDEEIGNLYKPWIERAVAAETALREALIRAKRVAPASEKEPDQHDERSRLPAASDKPPHDPSPQGRP